MPSEVLLKIASSDFAEARNTLLAAVSQRATAAAQRQYAADKQYYQQAQSSAQAAISDAQRLLGQATGDRDTAGRFGITPGMRQVQAQYEAATSGGAGLEERASRETCHRSRLLGAAGARDDVIEAH